MNKKRIAVVINPVSGGGRGRKVWQVLYPGLLALFDDIEYRMSNKVGDLHDLSIKLLEGKPDYFLIIGGDGTLSEALNGFYKNDKPRVARTKLAYFNAGCGGDFIRMFPHQHVTEFLERLIHQQHFSVNVGKIQFADQKVRYFINVASCGMSGHIAKISANSRWFRKFGGTVNYFMHSLAGIFSYRVQRVQIQLDDYPPFAAPMLLLAMCNGQYFGGKMHVAPVARNDDDLLDVVMFLNFSRFGALLKLITIYSGRHMHEKKVHYRQAKTVQISPIDASEEVPVEADGEIIGRLPAAFSLLPDKLSIIV